MARPKKHNADYFSHDADMRNDPRIKAVRRKFSHAGYAVWNMLLEVITDSDFFTIEWSEIDVEILAGDFDMTPDELREIVDYCVKLGLLQIAPHFYDNGSDALVCEKLKERFSDLLNKRERNAKKGVSDVQNPEQTEFQPPKPPQNGVSDVQNPQSKVKESKVKESKVKESKENISTQESSSCEIDGGAAASPPPSENLEVDGGNPKEIKTPSGDHSKNPPVPAPPLIESPDRPPILPPSEPPSENENEKNFKKFQAWITKNAPQIALFKEPFTQVEFERLKDDFSTVEIEDLLKKMHNYKPLLTKNISANLTFRNWANMDKKRNNATTTNRAHTVSTSRAAIEAQKRAERTDLAGLANAILSESSGAPSDGHR